MSTPKTWGELASERDALIDTIIAFQKFKAAMDRLEESIWKADARAEVDVARKELYEKLESVKPIILRYRGN